MITDAEFKALIVHPESAYKAPNDVLADEKLTYSQKLELLKSWKDNAEQLQQSTAEGMTGGENNRLDEVTRALITLKEQHG